MTRNIKAGFFTAEDEIEFANRSNSECVEYANAILKDWLAGQPEVFSWDDEYRYEWHRTTAYRHPATTRARLIEIEAIGDGE